MELDSRIIKYMQKKAEYAKVYACALSVQCFALAVFFCVYGLYETGLFYSQSREAGRVIIIAVSIILSIGLCVFNIMAVLRYKGFADIYPDDIAINQSKETVEEAYGIARPVLVLKITMSIALMLLSGLIYIMLMIFMQKSFMAGIYGRIELFIIVGFSIMIGIPCIDRIMTYKEMLKVRYCKKDDMTWLYPYIMVTGIGLPVSICVWYLLRCYWDKKETAWIVFPMTALFMLAFAYLSDFMKKPKKDN